MKDISAKSTLGEFPCNLCIVQAACNSFECSIMEEYLTTFHRAIPVLTWQEINSFRVSTPANLKKTMNTFNQSREKTRKQVSLVSFKKITYKITRSEDHKIKIKKYFE